MPSQAAQPDPATWIDRHADAMYRFARLRLASREAAEDAVQSALVAALQALPSYRGDSSERTWLMGIMRNKVVDAIRASARERDPAVMERVLVEAGRDDECCCGAGPDWSRSATGGAQAAEARALIRQALAALPGPMREAICLYEIDGLSGPAVCEVLGISATNLWTLVHRAKVRLRRSLEHHLEGREAQPGAIRAAIEGMRDG